MHKKSQDSAWICSMHNQATHTISTGTRVVTRASLAESPHPGGGPGAVCFRRAVNSGPTLEDRGGDSRGS